MNKEINVILGGVPINDNKLQELVMICKSRGMKPKFIVQCNPIDFNGESDHPKVSYIRTSIATPSGYAAIFEDPNNRTEWD
jgi:hypothetical protein